MASSKLPKSPGQAIQWTDQDLTDLSTVSPSDQKSASALWKNKAPNKFKNLLEAKPDES